MAAEISLGHLKVIFENLSLAKSLSKEGDGGDVWDAIQDTRTDKLLEGMTVIDLEYELFIAGVKELLGNQNHED